MSGYDKLSDNKNTITTSSSVVPAWLNLKLLATLASGYMFLMSVASPEYTVSKKYADFEGQQFQGVLLLGLILTFAFFVIGRMVPPKKAERPKTDSTKLLEDAAKKVIWNEKDRDAEKRVASRFFLSTITTQITASDNDEKHMKDANHRLDTAVSAAKKLVATHRQKIETVDKAERVITIISKKTEIANAVKNSVWEAKEKNAAGRLMKDVSLGNDLSAVDLNIVNNAKEKSVLLIKSVNGELLENKEQITVESALAKNNQENGADSKHVEEIIGAAQNSTVNNVAQIKTQIAKHYWTDQVLMCAGNIAAARAVNQTPDWDDVETVRMADRMSRLVGFKAMHSKELDISNDPWLTTIHSNVEKELHTANTPSEKLKATIAEKVKAYVWTSNPDLCYKKARVEAKVGLIRGDERAVQRAQERVVALCKKVTELLAFVEQSKKAVPHVINHIEGKFLVEEKDVTFDLIEKADSMLRQENRDNLHEAEHAKEQHDFENGVDDVNDMKFLEDAQNKEKQNPTENTLLGYVKKFF